MPQFFISLHGGAYCLVEHKSLMDLENTIVDTDSNDRFVELARPDGKFVLVDPAAVTLIQPPAPAVFKHTTEKE